MRRSVKSTTISAAELKSQIPDVAIVAGDLYGVDFRKGVARCLFSQNHSHGDRDPSLRHDRKKDRLFCASQNCFGEKGVDAIGLVQRMERLSFPEAIQKLVDHYGIKNGDRPNSPQPHHEPPVPADSVRQGLSRKGFRAVAEFAYGACLRKVRFEHESARQEGKNRAEKEFRWEHLVDGVWYSGDGGLPKLLYVNRALRERDQLGLAVGFEGEAKVDLAGELGVAAFSFKNITLEQAATLGDCDVVLWPDNDASGKEQADRAAGVICDVARARTVKLLTPPTEFPLAGDLIDAINDLKWDRTRIAQFLKTAAPRANGDRRHETHVNGFQKAPSAKAGTERECGNTHGTPRSGLESTSFRLTDDGVVYFDPDKEPLRICGRLEVAALTSDAKGEGWGRLLRWSDSNSRTHEWAMPMSLLAGDGNEYRSRLLDGGLFIAPGRRARDLLTVYLQTTRPQVQMLCVARVGWQGGSFVLPGATIGPEGAGAVLFQTAFETEHFLNISGTLDGWRANVGRFCSGNSRLILAVSCAFAGPALSLLGAESGGVHLVGPTSTGKSTALVVGGSVVGGGGRNGFVQSWRTTANGLEAIAELHNDLTLFLDELAQLDPKEAAEIAYLLANGSGKGRMSRNIGARKKLAWSLVFMSAGEITLADHAQTAGKRTKGGAEVRLLNIDADAGAGLGLFENIHGAESPDAFARQLKDAARQFYGTPLQAYLDVLVRNRSAAETALRNFQTDFLKTHVPDGASGEVSRAAQRFALVAATGELATDAGITGWDKGEATAAAALCLKSWITSRGTTGALDAESAVKQARRFFEAHGGSRFQQVSTDSSGEIQVVPNRAGFRRKTNEGGTEYLVFSETFKSEVCIGFDYRMVAHALEDRGFLERQPPGLMKRVRVPGNVDPIWIFCVKASILEG